ncbi:MAG: 3-deoxy-7-phosphoheptulonate synthase [Byssovorax sp.]
MPSADDLRLAASRPLPSPASLLDEMPVGAAGAEAVRRARREVEAVIRGEDDRLLVVVGPCSIHDPGAAREYAERLVSMRDRVADDLLLVMRVYFEKPRTLGGWRGLINDPHLDGSFAIDEGLRLARGLLRDLAALGMPAGTELLDPLTPLYLSDLLAWGAIGARTTESPIHRELASGMPMPVGFKNGTGGDVQIAVDAVRAARLAHRFLSVTTEGGFAAAETRGNDACHVILRGSRRGPNFQGHEVADAVMRLSAAGLPGRLMIDVSHGNSRKKAEAQPAVARAVAEQIRAGSQVVFGLMIESHLAFGRQDHRPSAPLARGQSITDACLGWDETVPVLEELARAARDRRARAGAATNPPSRTELDAVREEIDAIDDRILALLHERAEVALAAFSAKEAEGRPSFYDPERERTIVERLTGAPPGALPPSSVETIFREIIRACRLIQVRPPSGR